MDFTNQIGITNDQVYTNRRDINNLMELLGNFKQQLLQIEARLPPLGVTFVTNPMTTSLDGGGFTIFNVSGLTITGTSDLQGPLNVGGTAAFSTNVHITGDAITTGSLTVGNNATVAGTFGVTGATTLNNTLGVSGATTCGSTLTVSGATTLSSTLNVQAATTLDTTLDVSGATTLATLGVSGATTCGSTLNVSGATTLGGTLTVAAAATFNHDLSVYPNTFVNIYNSGQNGFQDNLLTIQGGATLSHNLTVNGNAALTGTLTVSGATTCGSTLNVSGATTCGSTLTVTDITTLIDSTNSGGKTSGALIVTGGVGIGGHLYADDLNITNSGYFGGALTVHGTSILNGPITAGASISVGTTLTVTGNTIINSTTSSINTSTGALTVAGGVGIAENLNVGGTLGVTGDTTLSNTLNISGATTCGSTLTVNGISTFNTDVNLVQTLTVGGIAQFNNDLKFSMSSLGNNYFGYIYEQSLGDSLFLDGPPPSNYNQFGEKIQIRSVSSSSASMSLNCYDAAGPPGNSARITFRKFPAESGNNGPVDNHVKIRANDYLGYIDWKANTSASTSSVNDTRLAWISTKAISTDNTIFGGQITFSTRSAGSGSFNNVLILQDNSSVQVGNATSENVKFFVYNDVSAFDTTVKIIDTKTGTIGCTLDLLHHSGSPASGDTVTILNFGGYNDAGTPQEINYGIIRCIADDVTQASEKGSIHFSTKNGSSYSDKMKLDHNGYLFIGDYNSISSNVDPNGRLQIIGNSDTSDEDCMLIIQDLDNTAGSQIPAIGFYDYTGTSQGRIRSNDTIGLILSGNGSHNDDLVLRSSKVGISMPDPEEKLHLIELSGTERSGIKLQTLLTVTPDITNCSLLSMATVKTTAAVTDGDYLGTINYGGGTRSADTSDYTTLSGSATNAVRLSVIAKGDWTTGAGRVCEFLIEKRRPTGLETALVINKDDKVGINYSDPKCALHVYNPTGGDATNAQEMETHGVLKLQPHATNSTNMTFAQVNNGNAMGIQVSNSAQTAHLDLCLQPFTNGKVGIGTIDPAYRFSVVESEHAANTDTAVINNAVAGSFGYLETNDIGNEAVDIELQLSRNYIGGEGLNAAAFIRAGKERQWSASGFRDSYLALGTRESSALPEERMRISSRGYVGIGTPTPLDILHVSANKTTYTYWGTVFRGGTTNNNSHSGISLHSTGDALSGIVGSNFNIQDLTLSQTNTNRSSGYIVIGNTTVAGKTSSFNFRGLVKGSTTPTDLLTINNDGYVGINETNPQRMLQVTADDDIAPTTLLALRNNRPSSSNKNTIIISFRDTVYDDSTLTTINDDFKEMSAIQHETIARDTTTGLESALSIYTRNNNAQINTATFGNVSDGNAIFLTFNTGLQSIQKNTAGTSTYTLFKRQPSSGGLFSSTGTCFISFENSGSSVTWGYIIDFYHSNSTFTTVPRATGNSQQTTNVSISESGFDIILSVTYPGGLGNYLKFAAGGHSMNVSYSI